MNNENEIERMARTFCHNSGYPSIVCDKCISKDCCSCKLYAERLIQAGIGDKKQAIKEFAEKLKRQSITLKDKSGWAQCVVVMAVEIDNLITELYGADE